MRNNQTAKQCLCRDNVRSYTSWSASTCNVACAQPTTSDVFAIKGLQFGEGAQPAVQRTSYKLIAMQEMKPHTSRKLYISVHRIQLRAPHAVAIDHEIGVHANRLDLALPGPHDRAHAVPTHEQLKTRTPTCAIFNALKLNTTGRMPALRVIAALVPLWTAQCSSMVGHSAAGDSFRPQPSEVGSGSTSQHHPTSMRPSLPLTHVKIDLYGATDVMCKGPVVERVYRKRK